MAALVLLPNPLTPHSREMLQLAAGTAVIEWLQEEHPQGFGMPIRFYVNGAEKDLDDLDYKLGEEDVAVIALMPAEPVSLTTLAVGFLLSAALSAATYFAMQAFMPKARSGKPGEEVSVYDVSSDQNAARIGEPIPVVYGQVITTPDYVMQPFTWYEWSQGNYDQYYNGIQYLNMLLCIGQGNIDVNAVYFGDTGSQTPDPGVVSWRAFKPAEHRSSPQVISAAMGGYFYENVVTSPEVGNQEFVNAGDSAGYFATCKPGLAGTEIMIDIIWPGGLFDVDVGSNAGDLVGRSCLFTAYYQELDANDNRIGPEYSTQIWASTSASASVTGPWGSAITTTSVSARNRTAIAAPLRRTYRIYAPKGARWAVKIVRNSGAPNAKNGTDRFIWAGLKILAYYPSSTIYGNVTLLAIRVKASQGLGTDAAIRVRAKVTRRMAGPSGGAEVQQFGAVDAFADAYMNTTYGGARPRSELDLTTLEALKIKWSAYSFNYVFRERTTVWEALRTITIPFAGEPLPLGSTMSIAADGVKLVRSAIFTDANIVSGTMNVSYEFAKDGDPYGVEIEYLDPSDFRQVYVQYPAGLPLLYEKYSLPGVTNVTHATQYARLVWNRNQFQRKRVTFDTELEGLLLQMGDRIGIAHDGVKWGDGGQVIGVSGNTLTVDHDLVWTGGTKQIILRATDGSISNALNVTRGAKDNKVVLPSGPPFNINVDNQYDYTTFAFGSASTIVRDFMVTAVRPSGETTVTVEAVNYTAGVYAGAMSYMLSV